MKTSYLVFLFLVVAVARSNAIVFDICSFSAILKENGLEGFSGTTIAEWICLVFHSSGFDTSALNVGPRATNHGIFLLSAKWWCDDFKTPHARNYCNVSCEENILHCKSGDIGILYYENYHTFAQSNIVTQL
uniref:lysozyme n=1 Tax=Pseudonaja textilis TaxID=8673 RepID=A0A670ZE10_PSETE